MLLSVIRLLGREPDLVFEHVAAYAALARAELSSTRKRWLLRAVAGLLSFVFLFAFLIVASVTATLVVAGTIAYSPALLAVPGAILLIGIVAGAVCRAQRRSERSELARELEADFRSLRTLVGGSR